MGKILTRDETNKRKYLLCEIKNGELLRHKEIVGEGNAISEYCEWCNQYNLPSNLDIAHIRYRLQCDGICQKRDSYSYILDMEFESSPEMSTYTTVKRIYSLKSLL